MSLDHLFHFQIRISKYFSYQSNCSRLKTIEFPFFNFQFSAQALLAVSLLKQEADFYH